MTQKEIKILLMKGRDNRVARNMDMYPLKDNPSVRDDYNRSLGYTEAINDILNVLYNQPIAFKISTGQ